MSNLKTVIIASNNAHKAEEIAHALDFPGWEFRTLKEAHIDSDPAEDADIFLGKIKMWNDAQITKLNPGLKLPAAPIVVIHRADGSGTTFLWTDYLSQVSAEW